jgi:D-methionine transport system ATP-binding protein
VSASEIIRAEHIVKDFTDKKSTHRVLTDVNLTIGRGEIFGIIGYSGAGKSTLVRCFNGIEKPTEGKIFFEGQNIVGLKDKALRPIRKKMGMIFQQFNLMPSRTVYENIALPLKHNQLSRKEMNHRITELLTLVDLPAKRNAYPAQLSGGQKQRVAIARALVNQPKILLCDEATSALDPETTKSILQLLKRLNDELSLTIVVITHEMSVIKEICQKVAVLDKGKIIEEGEVYAIFSNPQREITRSFIETTSSLGNIRNLLQTKSSAIQLRPGQVLLKMSYTANSVSEPLISHISRLFNVDANIIFSDLQILSDKPLGGLIAILSGQKQDIDRALDYIKQKHVSIEVLNHG